MKINTLDDVLALVPETERTLFRTFIETGDGPPEFLQKLETDPAYGAAVDAASLYLIQKLRTGDDNAENTG